ncbi:MAG TPA: MBL fold metallo-hydrolase [Syntrophorhabdales bacterium]|nr:MBL fold metallo-hydrolase [Syntrophorhabdales bacterium]
MKIAFVGAARQVTGSCFHLTVGERQFLVDCGMQQGEAADDANRAPFSFNPADIECLFLTHAHLDHSGLIPKLVNDGFKGKIITTTATADLIRIMLLDSAHIQEKDAEWMTKKSFRTGKEQVFEPLYTENDVKTSMRYLRPVMYDETNDLGNGMKYLFVDAGHILGSGSFELWYPSDRGQKKIVFSGDIGKKGNLIIEDPEYTLTADYVVMESTYGNRFHKGLEQSIDELAAAIKLTFQKGGNVLMPTFAVGRTQDVMYILNDLVREGKLEPMDLYVDSPLAEEATNVYLSHREYFGEEAKKLFQIQYKGRAVRIHFTKTVADSQEINRIKSGVIIMAGSGMCEGGRIAHHLKHNLWRPECSVIFTGFQARGTLGRRIVDGAKRVRVLGEGIAVKAAIYTIGGFSAHADQKELLEWLGSFTSKPEVFIVHGEEKTALEFESIVKERLGLVTHVPSKGEQFEI